MIWNRFKNFRVEEKGETNHTAQEKMLSSEKCARGKVELANSG